MERSPISDRSRHLRPSGIDDTEVRETYIDYMRKRESKDDAYSIENCYSIGQQRGHILFGLAGQI